MEIVSEALAGMGENLAILSKACDELSHRELIALLSGLATVVRTVPALEHQILARLLIETEPHRLGEASWKKVLTTGLRVSGREAGRRLARAKTLGPRRTVGGEPLAPLWESTAAAQAQGLLDEEHVSVIARFHKALPTWVDAGTRAQADEELARLGGGLDPENLATAARHLLAKIDQDGPEPSERERGRKRGLKLGRQQPDGTSWLSGWVTAKFRAAVEAVWAKEAAPGHHIPDYELDDSDDQTSIPDATAGGDETAEAAAEVADADRDAAGKAEPSVVDGRAADSADEDHDPPPEARGSDPRTQEQRNHDALEALAFRALESGQLGTHNGLPVTVIVSTTLQELQKGAGVAVTGGGTLLPMRDLIRLAAKAFHYLYVYDKHTEQSLYLGRAKRLANAAQRIALHGKERGCTRPGCSAPGYGAEVHHAVADWKDDLRLRARSPHARQDRLVHPQECQGPDRMASTTRSRHRTTSRQRVPPPRALPPARRRRP